jgi:hypothetical protein
VFFYNYSIGRTFGQIIYRPRFVAKFFTRLYNEDKPAALFTKKFVKKGLE